MKIILLKDAPKIGRKGQIVEVSDGYAKNFILPKKIGIIATSGALKQLDTAKAKKVSNLKEEVTKLVAIKKEIDAASIIILATPDSTGGINGKISTKQIASEIEKSIGKKIDKKCIEKKAISAFGVTQIKVTLYKGIEAIAKIDIRRK